jgi:hypothetical protein
LRCQMHFLHFLLLKRDMNRSFSSIIDVYWCIFQSTPTFAIRTGFQQRKSITTALGILFMALIHLAVNTFLATSCTVLNLEGKCTFPPLFPRFCPTHFSIAVVSNNSTKIKLSWAHLLLLGDGSKV